MFPNVEGDGFDRGLLGEGAAQVKDVGEVEAADLAMLQVGIGLSERVRWEEECRVCESSQMGMVQVCKCWEGWGEEGMMGDVMKT